MNTIDLTKTTFIIPIKIEHKDRYRNAQTTLNFLNRHFITNVIIHESSSTGKTRLDYLDSLSNLNITLMENLEETSFHRTKYLNQMLDIVETPVVVNYDIDVILDPENYLECQNQILSGESEVIYPYENGTGQIQVLEDFDYEGFANSGYDIDFINNSGKTRRHVSECGHCIFFKTEAYRKYGGENEAFVSYGPEDKERMYRFQKLSTVKWMDGKSVYHFEHFRGDDSWVTNTHFNSNWGVFENIKAMSNTDLVSHYLNPEYAGKYRNICKTGTII
jgi:predicted glycosyltransferase involved in capsule biosynthesis